MRVLALLFGCLLIVPALLACGPREQEFTSGEGRFTATFPGPVTTRVQTVSGRGHRFRIHYFEAEAGPSRCFVAYFDAVDPDVPFLPEPLEMLDDAWRALVEASGWKLERHRPLERLEYPGAEMLIRMPGGRSMTLLSYAVAHRIYFAAAFEGDEPQESISGNRCLDSLEIHPPPPRKPLF